MSADDAETRPPLRIALVAQVTATLVALIAFTSSPTLAAMPMAAALLQGICAAVLSHKLGAPFWWLPIHLGFAPLVLVASAFDIAPGWYLAGFLLLFLVFWRTDKSRVPLYLSNTATAEAVTQLLPVRPCWVIDLGCGSGGLLRQLARARPDCEFLGIEHAPLTFLWARLSALGLANVEVRWGNFWRQPLAAGDVVYAFLSPAPMAALWRKAQGEMRPGSLLISNSFPVPGADAEAVIEVADRRLTRLFCYRPAGRGSE